MFRQVTLDKTYNFIEYMCKLLLKKTNSMCGLGVSLYNISLVQSQNSIIHHVET